MSANTVGRRSILFGTNGQIDVTRGVAEFYARRPVLILDKSETLLTMPVEGIDAQRLSEFVELCAPMIPRLVITAQRAIALGHNATTPMALQLEENCNVETILALVGDANIDISTSTKPAGFAAAAAIKLAKLSQGFPAVLVADITTEAAITFEPKIITVKADAFRDFIDATIQSLTIASEASVPLNSGIRTRFVVFNDAMGCCSVAIVVGKPDFANPVPVRLHSACLTGDVFGSRRCDCGDQLELALARLENVGGGIILYMAQEGRGLGLANKMRAYEMQDDGLDTFDANTTLGFAHDEREYGIAAKMLQMLNCTRVVLLTNNPGKINGLTGAGIEIVSRMSLLAPINAHNRRYLMTKAARAGHRLDHLIY